MKRPHTYVLSLVERGGKQRSMMVDHRGVSARVHKHLHRDSRLVTDKAMHYTIADVAQHASADHSKYEWARGGAMTPFPAIAILIGAKRIRSEDHGIPS